MSETNKTPENNLTEARNYLNSLKLPEGYRFWLEFNGNTVLEDVSEEKDWIKTIDGYLEKDKKTLSEQVEDFNENSIDWNCSTENIPPKEESNRDKALRILKEFPSPLDDNYLKETILPEQTFPKKEKDMEILKNELADRIYDQTKKPCCGNNCKIKGSSKPITKESFLKNKLNDVKTPEAFFNYLEDILKREQLMIEDLKKFLTDLKESFMTTEKAKDYEYRENYVFFMYCLFNDILDNMERMTL